MSKDLFARRTAWDLKPNRLSETLQACRRGGADILDLTVSNPTTCGLGRSEDAILSALGQDKNCVYVPDASGLLNSREALSRHLTQQGTPVPADRLVLTCSTSEAYSFLFRLLANTGERVLFPRPSYPLFQFLSDLHDVTYDTYDVHLTSEGWVIDIDSLTMNNSGPVAAVVVVNPNNPTGSYIAETCRQRLNQWCRAQRAVLIADEVFFDYDWSNGRASPAVSLAENTEVLTFVLGGLSKSLGLPQMKLSWIGVNGPADDVAEAMSRLEVIADTYLSVSAPAQNALPVWLDQYEALHSPIRERVMRNRNDVESWCRHHPAVSVLPGQGGWYAVLKLPGGVDEEEMCVSLLTGQNVYVHPGYFFDFPKQPFLVISLLTDPDVFQRGVNGILDACRRAVSGSVSNRPQTQV